MIRLLSIMACALLSVAVSAVSVLDDGQYKDGRAEIVPAPMSENIRLTPPPPGGKFLANIVTDGTRFHTGDTLPIQFAVNKKSYVWIFNTDPNGRTVQVFPNYYDRNNCLDVGKTYGIPDRTYQITVTGPRGNNRLDIVAVNMEVDYAYLEQWRAYTLDNPYPATVTGAKGLTKYIDTVCDPNRGLIRPAKELHPVPPMEMHTMKSQTYYVMERVGGETAEYRVPRYGKLSINSYPTNGRIYVDGQYVGRTPQVMDRVTKGEHKVKILKEGYMPYECSYTVETSNFTQVEAFLKETPIEPGYKGTVKGLFKWDD